MSPRNIVRLGINNGHLPSDDDVILIACISGNILGCKQQKLTLGNLNRKAITG